MRAWCEPGAVSLSARRSTSPHRDSAWGERGVIVVETAMDPDLASFLGSRDPVVTEPVDWGNGFKFRVDAYLGGESPPLAFVTSVRAVVLRGAEVLVQRDRTTRHLLPGGRREPGEPPAAALAREVREETGWSLRSAAVLGFLRYHHLDPRPPDYPYPYPEFLHIVSVGWASTYSPAARLDDGYEIDSTFLPVAAVLALGVSRRERVFLEAALSAGEAPTYSAPASE